MFILILQRLFLEAVADIFYFPVWWYTRGALHAALWCIGFLKNGNRQLAPGLWLRNVFVPMYGQHDIAGRLVSFFMRAANIFIRSVLLLLWLVVCVAFFAAWLAIPLVISYGLVTSFRVVKN